MIVVLAKRAAAAEALMRVLTILYVSAVTGRVLGAADQVNPTFIYQFIIKCKRE